MKQKNLLKIIIGNIHFIILIYAIIFIALSQPDRDSYIGFYLVARPKIFGTTIDLAALIILLAAVMFFIDILNILILFIKKIYAIIKHKHVHSFVRMPYWLIMMVISMVSLISILYKLVLSF